MTALAVWLRSQLSGVKVSDRWPDTPTKADPPTGLVTCLLVGDASEFWTQPARAEHLDKAIHGATSARITTALAEDLPTAIARLNAARSSYQAHRIATPTHLAADLANTISEPAASDLDTAIDLANEMRTDVPTHEASTSVHSTADTRNTITAAGAEDLPTLITLTNAIVAALNAHYAAKVFAWRTVVVEQAVQIDTWATRDVVRDDLRRRVREALNAPPYLTAPLLNASEDPVDQQLVLPLAGDYEGAYARFMFDGDRTIDDEGARSSGQWRAMFTGRLDVSDIRWANWPAITEVTAPLTIQ